MVTKDEKSKGHLSFSRWKVSERGAVAHLRVGQAPETICGDTITKTGTTVSPSEVNPPCQDCERVLRGVKKDLAEQEKTDDGQP